MQTTQSTTLLGPGSPSVKQRLERNQAGPKSKVLGMLLMILTPWAIFFFTQLLFAFLFHRYEILTGLSLLVLVFFSGLLMMLDSRNKYGGRWYLKLGVLCLLAVSLSTYLGLLNYHYQLANYWTYSESTAYVNVLPSEAAASKADAGKMLFTVDARVDTEKSVGFKAKNVYCVAPIVDYATSSVQFWATGLNCCPARGAFTCGDVWNSKARSALVVLDNRGFFPSELDVYKKAANQACAEWELKEAERPLFLRWVADATVAQDEYWTQGIGYMVAYSGVYLLLQVMAGAVVQMSVSRREAVLYTGGVGVGAPPGSTGFFAGGGGGRLFGGGSAATTGGAKSGSSIRLPPV